MHVFEASSIKALFGTVKSVCAAGYGADDDPAAIGCGQGCRETVGPVFPSRFLGSCWVYLCVPSSSNGSELEVVVLGAFE